MQKKSYLLLAILALGAFLLFYRLSELMIFIGDQGWFYLSARDMILTGHIPLVGITSSHTWLHQGALFTYILGLILFLFRFNPLVPGYLLASVSLVTAFLLYRFGNVYLSHRIGLLSSLFYLTSPLVIIHSRMPYHTTLIPLVTVCLLFALMKWLKGKMLYFPLVIFFLAVLYNFELATVVFWLIPFLFLIWGWWQKKQWVIKLWNKRVIFLSLIAWIIPMFPILLYDSMHGFPQTVKFAAWTAYKALSVFTFSSHDQSTSMGTFFLFTATLFQRLLFLPNLLIALLIFFSICFVSCLFLYNAWKKKIIENPQVVVSSMFILGLLGYLTAKTTSEAYFPMLFVSSLLLFSVVCDHLYQKHQTSMLAIVFIVLISLGNAFALLSTNYLIGDKGYGPSFSEREAVAKEIVAKSQGNVYTIKGKGERSQFASFTMNYAYLTWWLGHGPSNKTEKLVFTLEEHKGKVLLFEQRQE